MAGLTAGDRIPDFSRPDHTGQPCLFHDLYYGQPIVLFAGGSSVTDARAALAALCADDAGWKDVTRVLMLQATPAQCAALAAEFQPSFKLLADDGQFGAYLLGNPIPPWPTAFVLDSNLRIADRLQLDPREEARAFLERVADLYTCRPQAQTVVVSQQAPVLLIPGVFDRGLCDDLIALFEETGGQPSGTGYVQGNQVNWKPDPTVKMRRDIYLQEGAWLERVKDAIVRRVLPEIHRCYNFQVTQHEVFKVIRYDADTGGYFRPHRDNQSLDTQHRRFAMTLNLNTGDYQGGELRFPEFGPNLYEASRGGAALFSCSLLHEAMPVIRGRRYALLGFFFGEGQQMNVMQTRDAR